MKRFGCKIKNAAKKKFGASQTSAGSTGFTLLELLVVIAIISILFSVVFVALDPLKRFRDSRDSARWQDVGALANAIKLNQVDNRGNYLTYISNLTAGEVYMITDGAMNIGCDDNNDACDVDVTRDYNCVDLSELVSGGYIGAIPVSQSSSINWDKGTTTGQNGSGYTLQRYNNGMIIVRACESEGSGEIFMIR